MKLPNPLFVLVGALLLLFSATAAAAKKPLKVFMLVGDWKLVAAKVDPWKLDDLSGDQAEQSGLPRETAPTRPKSKPVKTQQ